MVGLAFSAGVYFGCNSLANAFKKQGTITTKGLSERIVKADQGKWKITLTVKSKEIDSGIEKINTAKTTMENTLKAMNFTKLDMGRVGVYQGEIEEESIVDKDGNKLVKKGIQNIFTCDFLVEETDAEKLKAAEIDLLPYFRDGIEISERKSYKLLSFDSLRPVMLQETVTSAINMAKTFLKSSGGSLGKVQSASQGAFTIVPVNQTSEWDTNHEGEIEKKIRVVSTIVFEVK